MESSKGEIVMYQPDETIRLEVRVENETVWLNRQQIAALFSRDVKTIGKHISNALHEELEGESVVAKFATTASDGKNYQVEYYNLDMIMSVGFYTRQLSQQQQLAVQRHNQQYPPVTVNACSHNHDRFLIIDDIVYLFGASLKDAGKKLFAYIKMQETTATDILNWIR
ncbi:MAG: DNA-binding protein [Bacteroidaceae bacterium]|nr:DNA-binding protein [Bacteroidaceae bacterium]